jgi:hypothetical protein
LTTTDHGIFTLMTKGNLAIMDFNPEGDRYPQELVDDVYARECKYLLQLAKYSWAPEAVNFDKQFRRIYFKWYGNTCEDIVPDDYAEQLLQITKDLHTEQIYKPSFYTKYFYVDDRNKLHAWSFYSASSYNEQPIAMDFYRPILNNQREELVNKLESDGKLDMKLLVERGFNEYIQWPGNPLPSIYQSVYNS